MPSPASKVRSALFAFSKVVYTANKDKQYRVFKEEVRSLASEVGAKHLAKSSSPFAGRLKERFFYKNQEAVKGLNSVRPLGKDQFIHIS